MEFLKSFFKKISFLTIANVYLVILAGGVVRCTGSGMGCPDWPKCFGRWIPPTEISELPDNYVELYSEGGHLTVEFNVYKTWTEYINRLLGVLVGLFVFANLLSSVGYYKSNKSIFYYSLAAFLLTGFQGWLGAKVVATNLKPFMITLHMLVAMVIVGVLLKARAKTDQSTGYTNINIKNTALVVCLLVLLQILVGTQVRQAIDVVSQQFFDRSLWIENAGFTLKLHTFLAYLVIASVIYLCYILYKNSISKYIIWGLMIAISVEYIGGIVMYRYSIPSYMQPIHLTCASLLFGLSFYLYSVYKSGAQIDS